jgi:two-component system cell cycle response regulator DivK
MAAELILIAEDNPKNLKLVRDLLQHHGYATIDADSGEKAIDLAASAHPDLILMDIQLPGMDGFDALRRLKADERTAGIIVCALTAFAMPDDRVRCIRAGFDGYLVKPISVSEFPDQIKRLLEQTEEGAVP